MPTPIPSLGCCCTLSARRLPLGRPTGWMILLVLFSSLAGFIWREWTGCKPRTWVMLILALAILIGAVLSLSYGNYPGELANTSH